MTSDAGLPRPVHEAAVRLAAAGMPKYEELQNLYRILFYTSLCSPAQGCVQCVWLLWKVTAHLLLGCFEEAIHLLPAWHIPK